jgi:hypothetical protein
MKKIILLLFLISIFRSANAQLEFYEFGFNLFENVVHAADTNTFKVLYMQTDRETGVVRTFPEVKLSKDTSKTYGYDYLLVEAPAMLRYCIVNILIIKNDADTMNIEINKLNSSAWEMLGMDRISFLKGNFLINERSWPQNRRDRYLQHRYFPYLDEEFDWEKVRKK